MAVSYHDTVTKLQAPDHAGSNPFDRADWFALLEKHGAQPLVAVARDGENTLALPLERGSEGLRAMRHVFAFTWRPLVVAGEASPSLCEAVAKDLRSRAHRVTLDYLPEDVADDLETAFRAAGRWIVRREPCDTNHILAVEGRSFADYWAQRPGRMRTTLKRKAGKVDVELTSDFSEGFWNEYKDIYAKSWKTEEKDIALLRDLARMEADAGRLRLGMARHEGVPVAAQLWTVENGTAFIHKLSYDEDYKRLSAGTTLTAALMEQAIDRDRVALVDFGTGDDVYKADWMDRTRTRYTLTAVDPWQWRGAMFLFRKVLGRVARPLAPR